MCVLKRIVIALMIFLLLTSLASAATLNVGPKEKYNTIQKAVNAAKSGDTIKVASGTYKENVKITKYLTFLGTNYPKVDGFYYASEAGTINGFSIQKYGIDAGYVGGPTIRNNYFYNCGIGIAGWGAAQSSIINNQITGGTIYLYDSMGKSGTITGNTISKSECGLYIGDMTGYPTATKNTFKGCQYGVYIYTDTYPGKLDTFIGNKYSGNKVNIGWGVKPPI